MVLWKALLPDDYFTKKSSLKALRRCPHSQNVLILRPPDRNNDSFYLGDCTQKYMERRIKMFSFVIRTKNEAAFLSQTLRAIKNQITMEKIEIVIVDSGSSDTTLEIAEQYDCRIIKINPERFTWGYALNVGIQNAQGEYIGIISGHCVLTAEDFVTKSVHILKTDDELAAVYGRQVGMRGMDPFEEVDLNYHYPEMDLDVVCGAEKAAIGVSNACCVLKKSIWDTMKFDENVQSCEDGLWSEAVLDAGGKLAYSSKIGVYHSHKMNAEYLYRKDYWREYCPEYNRLHTHTIFYNFLKFMIKKNYSEFKFYESGLKKMQISCQKQYIIYYVLIRNTARMKASNDLAKHSTDEMKYEQIITPGFIQWMQNKLKKGGFWLYN